MSKVICDICGTSYPDNAAACPICGFPRKDNTNMSEEEEAILADAVEEEVTESKSKGGRFSNKNVKKRNRSGDSGESHHRHHQQERPTSGKTKVLVALLAVAVVVVGAYIGFRFWQGRDAYDNPSAPVIGTNPSTETTQTQPTETTLPAETGVPCTGLAVSDASVEFLGTGRGWKLSIITIPSDTTDEVIFTSSDENVVTVTPDGRLTSVGPGEATITITCGAVSKECKVYCDFEPETEPPETTLPEETTEPEETEPETTAATEPEQTQRGFQLDPSDVTLRYAGEYFTIRSTYDGTYISPSQIVWESNDPAIATVDNGRVTAVGRGTTTILATYNGITKECIVRCVWEEEETTAPTDPTEPETTEPDNTIPADSNWKASHSDVTLIIGESFTLTVTNDAGQVANVTWSADTADIVSISGNTIKGLNEGTVTLTASYGSKTFTCIVRVRATRG